MFSVVRRRVYTSISGDSSAMGLIAPPIAFQAEWPPFMYFASKPASRSMIAVLQPTWKPYTQNTTTGSDFDSPLDHSCTRSGSRQVAPSMILLPRHGVPRASVDDLNWLASLDHRLHLPHADAGQVAELLLHQRPRWLDFDCILVAAFRSLPVDVLYERIDVSPRVRAKVDVVRVLVHIEREDGNAARDAQRVL